MHGCKIVMHKICAAFFWNILYIDDHHSNQSAVVWYCIVLQVDITSRMMLCAGTETVTSWLDFPVDFSLSYQRI